MQNPADVSITLVAIDEDPAGLRLVRKALDQEQLDIFGCTDAAEGLDLVFRKKPQIVLLDWIMPKLSGELLQRIVAVLPETAVILIGHNVSPASAAEAVRQGAFDFLTGPISPEALRERIRLIIHHVRRSHNVHGSRRNGGLGHALAETPCFQGLIGRSPAMLEVFDRIRRIASHFRTVLLCGETGTGKELAARALHDLSPAGVGPFVAVNCPAVVETLFESELFGYAKGAFTGARQDKLGLFEYAHGGTLLLDEVGDMPLGLQSKLLRVLQNQEFLRLGSPVPRKIDIRVVAATNRDLRAMVTAGKFRQDLYYRLSMVEIRLPRLADRKEDLPILEQYFLHRFSHEFRKPFSGLTSRARVLLEAYPWPGNVRELENALGHACMMSSGDWIDVGDLPPHLFEQGADSERERGHILPLSEFERSYVRRVLISFDGNKVRTAEALGISRSKLYSLLVERDREK